MCLSSAVNLDNGDIISGKACAFRWHFRGDINSTCNQKLMYRPVLIMGKTCFVRRKLPVPPSQVYFLLLLCFISVFFLFVSLTGWIFARIFYIMLNVNFVATMCITRIDFGRNNYNCQNLLNNKFQGKNNFCNQSIFLVIYPSSVLLISHWDILGFGGCHTMYISSHLCKRLRERSCCYYIVNETRHPRRIWSFTWWILCRHMYFVFREGAQSRESWYFCPAFVISSLLLSGASRRASLLPWGSRARCQIST